VPVPNDVVSLTERFRQAIEREAQLSVTNHSNLFDRSIPVAYERGKNHNVDRAVTLRRFIE